MIARSAQADRGIVMSNHANAVASTFDTITRVIYWGYLAHPLLHCVSRVADADCSVGTKRTTPMLTTVDHRTWIRGGDAIVAHPVVALVADA